MISLEGVRLSFDGAEVLRGVDLRLEAGAIVGLIGPPSVGKSVLLKLIAGLIRPSAGRVEVGGEDLASMPAARLREVRKTIGMVFQNNALFDSKTIFENVAFPLRRATVPVSQEEIDRRVRARLADVGLAGTEGRYPHELSGGMQKRAGIARATVFGPAIRLYDEPTAGLDPVTASRILALIAAIHAEDAGGVSVVVSNEMDSLLAAVPRVVMLHGGRVAYDGPRTELREGGAAPQLARAFVAGDDAFDALSDNARG